MADYDWFSNRPKSKAELDAIKYRPLGFHPIRIMTSSGTLSQQVYACRRGCGTVVWSPEIHMKNVCPEFHPVAGSD